MNNADNSIDYSVKVIVPSELGSKIDILLVTASDLDQAKEYVRYSVRRRMFSFEPDDANIPHNRPATFREELFNFDHAGIALKQSREKDIEGIEQILKEAYGDAAIITVKKIE